MQMFLRCRATGSVRIRVHTISVVSAASAAKKAGLRTAMIQVLGYRANTGMHAT
ncbi:hypothetical protein CVCC1112_4446 [Paenarthrobacter nicotinovorans]|nr:hypothetical protein ANMWB30_40340 [Arthrobacter sp. MWB30]GAT89787.1 hypothetical protein CVCC1112_4446 [Paenarthrobacter nicotinovorans]